MKASQKKRLKEAGWEVGSIERFLGLTKAEGAFVRLKAALARELRRRRASKHVASKDSGEESFSIDRLLDGLFEMEMSLSELAEVVRGDGNRRAA